MSKNDKLGCSVDLPIPRFINKLTVMFSHQCLKMEHGWNVNGGEVTVWSQRLKWKDSRGSEEDSRRMKRVGGWVSRFQAQWLHMLFAGRGRVTATVCSFNESVCAGRAKGLIKTVLKGSVISSSQPIKTLVPCVPVCRMHSHVRTQMLERKTTSVTLLT